MLTIIEQQKCVVHFNHPIKIKGMNFLVGRVEPRSPNYPPEMMSTSAETNKSSRSHPNTPTSRLARSAITSRQLFEDGADDNNKNSSNDSMSAAFLGSPMATATTTTDEFAGELPPPPSSPAISYADRMEQIDESNFTFRKSHAGVLTLRQQEKVCFILVICEHRLWMRLRRRTLT